MPASALTICERIGALIDTSTRGAAPPLVEIERTLTDGYAHAHLLEAEHRRVERRIAELASRARERDAKATAAELSKLASRAETVAAERATLRKLLATLRRRHSALQAA